MPCFPVARLMLFAAVRHVVTFATEFRPSTSTNHTQLRVTARSRIVRRHVKVAFVGRIFRIKFIYQMQLRAQDDEVIACVLTTARRIAAQKNENHPMHGFFRCILLQQEYTWLTTSTAFQNLRQWQRLQRQPCRFTADFVRKIVTKRLPRFASIDFKHVININNITRRHFPA